MVNRSTATTTPHAGCEGEGPTGLEQSSECNTTRLFLLCLMISRSLIIEPGVRV